MVLAGSTFKDEIQSRIKNYGVVADETIPVGSDKYVDSITTASASKNSKQAIAIPGSQEPGYSSVYRNAHCPDRLISSPHPEISTFPQLLDAAVANEPNADCLGERHYSTAAKKWGHFEFQSYTQVRERAQHTACGIVNIVEEKTGLEPHSQQYTVGLYGPNSRNWAITDIACSLTALTSVPLYDTLGPDSTEYIINLTEMPIIFASLAHIPFILSNKAKLPSIKIVVSLNEFETFDGFEKAGHSKRDLLTKWGESVGVSVYSMSDIENLGKEKPRNLRVLVPDDVHTLCFTSGTTGNPKGVIITASAVCAAVCVAKFHAAFLDTNGQLSYLSFLPLAHIYERVNCYSLIVSCKRIGFLHGDVTEVFDDIAELKPTLLAGVPRIWNRLAAAIKASTIEGSGVAGMLSRKAFASKSAKLVETGDYNDFIWDRLWSNKIRRKLGLDKTSVFISGSAPLAAENVELLKCSLAVDCLQGYGLTESSSGISITLLHDIGAGSVGPVAPTTEVRLRELPDMGYTASDKPNPRGEIMLRGPHIFKGYYKNEEETDKAFDKDGWFHTGDVGMIDSSGRLYIIDRVKNMFKLAQGEYVGPERIEAIYQSSSSLIGQMFIDGNSLEVFLVAIVGIMPEAYSLWLRNRFHQSIDPTDVVALEETFKKKEVRKAFNEEINKDAKKAGLKGFEMVKNLNLFIEPMTSANGILTPTMKVKRKEASSYFKDIIDSMYKEGQIIEAAAKAMAKL